MGIKLVVEVLDHYHGPDHKFRWLVAFAEKANDHTRTGWPGRDVMTRRTGKSPSRASHIAAELVADGVIRREGGGGRNRGNVRYTLAPITPQGAFWTHPEDESQGAPATHSQGAPATHSQGARPTPLPAQTVLPIPSIEPSIEPSGTPTAQTLLGDFIDWDRGNGGNLTRRTIGQLAKHIAALLAEGVGDRYIRIGLADWRAKGQHPAALDSFVNAAMNGRARGRHRRASTGDRAVAEAEELIAEMRDRKELA